MATTFPALLADAAPGRPGRPLVTFYDDATGERVELSVATYANWVAKTSSLFVEELDLGRGDRIRVDLPAHWLTPVFLGAAWNVGLVVVPAGEEPDAVVCGPEGLEAYADRAGALPVVACALKPLGVRFSEPLPPDVHDFGIEVWSQPDAFLPYDPPTADDEALPGTDQADPAGPDRRRLPLADGDRLLTTANPAAPRARLVRAAAGARRLGRVGAARRPVVVAAPPRHDASGRPPRWVSRPGRSPRSPRRGTSGTDPARLPGQQPEVPGRLLPDHQVGVAVAVHVAGAEHPVVARQAGGRPWSASR